MSLLCLRRVGEISSNSVNHLMCEHFHDSCREKFTSRYVAERALQVGGNENVRFVYNVASGLRNPSFTGWVVEMDLIIQITNEKGGSFRVGDGELWKVADVVKFDVKEDSFKNYVGPIKEDLWLIPKRWDQPGYDLVCVLKHDNKQWMLRFVQVTISESHDLKLQYFQQLATFLAKEVWNVEIPRIEIVFMAPNGVNIDKIRLTSTRVISQGLLSAWNVGTLDTMWLTGTEHDLVRYLNFESNGYSCE